MSIEYGGFSVYFAVVGVEINVEESAHLRFDKALCVALVLVRFEV